MKTTFVLSLSLLGAVTACSFTGDASTAAESGEAAVISPARVRFEKLFECDGGAAYVDVNAEERRHLQLVVNDRGILLHLQKSGAVSLPFGAREATFRGFTGVRIEDHFGPKLRAANPYGGRGVFSRGDFDRFIAEYRDFANDGPLVDVRREGDGLAVTWGTIETLDCAEWRFVPGGDGFPSRHECVAHHSRFVEVANWHFRSCTF